MTKQLTIKLTGMAHGGAAVGRDKQGHPIFVPYAIPGETVQARITQEKQNFARAELLTVLRPSPNRIQPRCPHFGECGGCHLQHMDYATQLEVKHDVVVDQLQRIGGLKQVNVKPTLPHPQPWAYRIESSFSPTKEGGLGFWAPHQRRVMPIETCHIMQPRLLELLQDFDLDLPGLRKLTLRIGSDGEVLAAFEVDGVEPPQLAVDFPLSVAIVLPNRTAASLIGDPYLVQTVKGHDFRVSPGCFFQPSLASAANLVDTVLTYADLQGTETVLEAYSGVGFLTAFLAEGAQGVTAVEVNSDAVGDTAVNLEHTENVTLYAGLAEEILPAMARRPDLMVVNPPASGLSRGVLKTIKQLKPAKLIYVSSDIATMARDGKQLSHDGLRLLEVQPLDLTPQAFQVDTVSLWR